MPNITELQVVERVIELDRCLQGGLDAFTQSYFNEPLTETQHIQVATTYILPAIVEALHRDLSLGGTRDLCAERMQAFRDNQRQGDDAASYLNELANWGRTNNGPRRSSRPQNQMAIPPVDQIDLDSML